MSIIPETQPQSANKKPASISTFLIKRFSQNIKDSKIDIVTFVAAITLAALFKLYSLIKPGISEIIKRATIEDLLTITGALLLVIFTLIVRYLNNNQSKFNKGIEDLIQETEQAVRREKIIETISNFEKTKTKERADTVINKEDSELIDNKELNKIYEKIIEDNAYIVKNKIDKKRSKASILYYRINNAVERLKKEIEQLSRRANINLGIGSTVTIAALASLSYFIVREDFNSPDIKVAIFHFVPRLSLVIFIEFFSFFFLKLYRANLHEIKYYQNELTNLEVKALAIELAVKHGSKDDVSTLVKDMSLVERNFKLQPGESTVELERNKAETHDLKEVLKALIGNYKKEK